MARYRIEKVRESEDFDVWYCWWLTACGEIIDKFNNYGQAKKAKRRLIQLDKERKNRETA